MLVSKLARRIAAGIFAVADQSLIAGSNFLVSTLLARWLNPAEYGAYAASYTGFQLLMTMHAALTVEPLLVLGTSKYRTRLQSYVSAVSSLQWLPGIFVLMFGLVLSAVLGLRRPGTLVSAILALSVVAPVILAQQFMRRAFYVELRPSRSVLGGVAYLLTMVGVLVCIYQYGSISAASGFYAIGLASLSAVGVYRYWLKAPPGAEPIDKREVLLHHWLYGRWSVPTTFLTWVPGNLCYTLLPLWHGLRATAELQAIMNLILPVQHMISAIAVLLVPAFGRVLSVRGGRALALQVRKSVALFAAAACLYGVFVIWAGPAVAGWLYGFGKYGIARDTLVLGAVLGVSSAVTSVLAGALRALNKPRSVFACYSASFIFGITGGLMLMYALGVRGALWGLVISSGLTVVTLRNKLKSIFSVGIGERTH